MKHLLIACIAMVGGALFAADAKPLVVIEDFVNQSDCDARLMSTLKSRIGDEVINTRKFTILERGENLKTALAERSRIASGAVTPDDATPGQETVLPSLRAAGYAVYGEILFLGVDQTSMKQVDSASTIASVTAKVNIQLRLADIETGEILSSKSVEAINTASRQAGGSVTSTSNYDQQALNGAIVMAAKKVVGALMDLAYPAKILLVNVASNTFTVNLTEEQTAVGKLYNIFAVGEELRDPDTNDLLGTAEVPMGRAKVLFAHPKTAILQPLEKGAINLLEKGMTIREVDEATLKAEQQVEKEAAKDRFRERF